MIKLCGAKVVIAKCDEDSDFKLTASKLKSLLSDKTKLLILNSPNNPTGKVYSGEELNNLSEVIIGHNKINILSDDIYNKLVFSGSKAPHILNAEPALKEKTVIINGMSKAYSMTGWRIGWAVGNKEVIGAMSRFQGQSVSCAVSFCQRASVSGLKNSDKKLSEIISELIDRKDKALDLIKKIEGLRVSPPGGAFYLWIDISNYFGKKHKNVTLNNSSDICDALLNSKFVTLVPGSDFGFEGYVRMSYALRTEVMREAISRMADFFDGLS